MKKQKNIFFCRICTKKEWPKAVLNRRNAKNKQKGQHTAIRNDISFSFQKLAFQFQFCQLCPKTARPEYVAKPPPSGLNTILT